MHIIKKTSVINPTPAIYVLHSLHGQLIIGFHVLVAFLKATKDLFHVINYFHLQYNKLRLMAQIICCILKLKISFKMFGAIILGTLIISLSTVCKFQVCTETGLSRLSNYSKFEIFSL